VTFLVALGWMLGARGDRPFAGPVADGSWVGRTRAWFSTSGFYRAEEDKARGVHFSWTRRQFRITIPALDRRRAHRLTMRVAAGRPAPPLPEATISVDGIVVDRRLVPNDPQTIALEIPAAARASAIVDVALSNEFAPGPQDKRALGIIVEEIAIAPAPGSRFVVPHATTLRAAGALALYAAGVALAGTPIAWAAGAGAAAGLGHAWLLSIDGAFMGGYASRLMHVGWGVAATGVVVALLVASRRQRSLSGWPTAAALVAVIAGLKLSMLMHPAALIGDSVFQVHRAEWVHGGRYFFTSLTPRPYFEFPYAIGLYVTSLPFWDYFPSTAERVVLLRGLSITADAGVAVALYVLAVRFWQNRAAALAAAVLYPLLRLGTVTLCTGNLTNMFAQAIFGLAMAFIVARVGRPMPVAGMMVAGMLLAYAFLSHFSTASIGVPLVVVVAAAMLVGRQPEQRRAARWIAGALVIASILSYGLYYSHFHDVYRQTLTRVAAREGEAEQRSMVRPPARKAVDYARMTRESFGLPLLTLAAAGGLLLALERRRDPLTLALCGWLAAIAGFAVLGIFTPVEMRANLAAQPLVAALAAYAVGACAARFGRPGMAVAVGLAAVPVVHGVMSWRSCLGS
jgi:hypothetical protein